MVVGGGCDDDQALLNAVLAVLKGDGHRPSASIVSNSWQIPIGDLSPQTVHAQPAYQKGVVPPSMSHVRMDGRTVVNRAVPDIAAVADLDTGMLTGYTADGRYQAQVNAGTSLAAPLVAGMVADAQQGQRSSFGFINPLIYKLSGTRALHDVLPVTPTIPQQNRAAYTPATAEDSATVDVFDSRGPDTDQVTARGYDTITGVGTPNGLAFILALRLAS